MSLNSLPAFLRNEPQWKYCYLIVQAPVSLGFLHGILTLGTYWFNWQMFSSTSFRAGEGRHVRGAGIWEVQLCNTSRRCFPVSSVSWCEGTLRVTWLVFVTVGRCSRRSITFLLHQLVFLACGTRNEESRLCVGVERCQCSAALRTVSNCREFNTAEGAQLLPDFMWIREISQNNHATDNLEMHSCLIKC